MPRTRIVLRKRHAPSGSRTGVNVPPGWTGFLMWCSRSLKWRRTTSIARAMSVEALTTRHASLGTLIGAEPPAHRRRADRMIPPLGGFRAEGIVAGKKQLEVRKVVVAPEQLVTHD